MHQVQLPIFAQGVTVIRNALAFEKRDGRVTYFNGTMPVFSHAEDDLRTFRMITSQFCAHGICTQSDIVRVFGVPLSTVKRYSALYRSKGPAGFYAPRAHRGAGVLTAPVMQQAQLLLDEHKKVAEVARELGIKHDTLQKAVRAGRLHAEKKRPQPR